MARILIVDDDPNSRQLLTMQLTSVQHDVSETLDGEACLKEVPKVKPDVVILDVMMPALDGWSVCKKLKSDPKTKDIGVIILTARAFVGGERMSQESGADAYLEKPWEKKKLIDSVTSVLKKQK